MLMDDEGFDSFPGQILVILGGKDKAALSPRKPAGAKKRFWRLLDGLRRQDSKPDRRQRSHRRAGTLDHAVE